MTAGPVPEAAAATLEDLAVLARRLRIHSIRATAAAGSGHPTSCLSAAELVAAIFFRAMRFDPRNPKDPDADRFVLSKGHAAPILFAAYAEAGALPVERLETLRKLGSELEGHPVPRFPWVDVATGSLGQGLSVACGIALEQRRLSGRAARTYCLLGDGECAEGSVYEAAALAAREGLANLVAVVDANGLGQSGATPHASEPEVYARRFEAFGFRSQVVDGHDLAEVCAALEWATRAARLPSAIVARTVKGKGVRSVEGKGGWHGKPFAGEALDAALAELGPLPPAPPVRIAPPPPGPGDALAAAAAAAGPMPAPAYERGQSVATREAYGAALAALGGVDRRVVALDGDTKNSTYSEKFLAAHPDRFVEAYIAEQNMVGVAAGLAARGALPFASTFACFLTRAYDQIRMAAISRVPIKLCGSHAGVSIGEDGPSQMGLEDLAMMRAVPGCAVLYPSDAVSAWKLTGAAAHAWAGPAYIRTSRPKTPVLYANDEAFPVGGLKVHGAGEGDRATVFAAGVTLHEALKAQKALRAEGVPVRVVDLYSLAPLDAAAVAREARGGAGAVVTVEDHYPAGGLGEAVLAALAGTDAVRRSARLAVTDVPRSGKPEELLAHFRIDAAAIAAAVRSLLPF